MRDNGIMACYGSFTWLAIMLWVSIGLGASHASAAQATDPDASAETRLEQRAQKPLRGDLKRSKTLVSIINTLEPLTQAHWFRDDSEERFVGLYQADLSGNTRGNVLILHDTWQHPHWPGSVAELRSGLPHHGWNTLTIGLPDYWPPDQVPARPREPAAESTEPNGKPTGPATKTAPPQNKKAAAQKPPMPSETESDAKTWRQREVEYAPETYTDEFAARLQLGIDYLNQEYSGPLLVIASGEAGAWLVAQLAVQVPGRVLGIVLIDVAEPAHTDLDLANNLSKLSLPVVDLIPESSPRHPPAQRRALMTQARRQAYEQRQMPAGQRLQDTHQHVLRIVRGWAVRQLQQGD